MFDGAPGHCRSHPAPAYPASHVHVASSSHVPWPEQNAATAVVDESTAAPVPSTAPAHAWHRVGLASAAVNCHHVGVDGTPHKSVPSTPLWHVPVSYDQPHPVSAKHAEHEECAVHDGQQPNCSSGDAHVASLNMQVDVSEHHPHWSSSAQEAHVERRPQ